jgi:predicted SprT family Zn-dependent metalloprotease
VNVNELRVLINERIDEVLTIAHERYGFPGHEVETRFDLRGLAAGTAQTTREDNIGTYRRILRFNLEACTSGEDSHGYRNTVPHEIAHLVVQWRWLSRDLLGFRHKPQAHGSEWRSVCIALGGNGERCHSEQLTRTRPKIVHIYRVPVAGEVKVSTVVHNKIQRGCFYRFKGERIAAESYKGSNKITKGN